MVEAMTGVQMSCTAVRWDAAHHGEIDACWRQVLQRLPASTVFHYPEWIALAREAGTVKPWRVLIIRRGEQPLAVIPLAKRTPWTADILGDFAHENPPLLIDPAAEGEVWACLAEWMRGRPGVGLVYLGSYADQDFIARFRRAMRQQNLTTFAPSLMPLFTIPLAADWDDYLGTLGHRTRANIRRLERQFEQEMPGATFQVLTASPAADDALEDFIRLYRRRWRDLVGGSGLESAEQRRCYRETFHWAVQQGFAAIPTVRMDGTTVAALTLFHLPGQSAMQVHRFVREREVELPKHFSLGILLCAKTFRWAIEQGVRTVGMSYSSNEYKQLLGGEEHPRCELHLARTPLAGTLYYRLNSLQDYLARPGKYLRYLIRKMGTESDKIVGSVPIITDN